MEQFENWKPSDCWPHTKRPYHLEELKLMLRIDRQKRQELGESRLIDCIGKVTISNQTSSEIMHSLLPSNPHTFLIKN